MRIGSPLTRFVLRVLAWLPVAFAVWYFAAPVLLWPAAWLVRIVARLAFGDLVQAVQQAGAVLVFLTTVRPGAAGAVGGTVTIEVNALLYAFGLPLFAALTLAADRGRWRTLLLGYLIVLPVVAWGTLADFLRNIAITAGPLIASQTGFSAAQREAIAFAYQFGSLILPTVVPAIAWVVTHRAFLERIRGEALAPAR